MLFVLGAVRFVWMYAWCISSQVYIVAVVYVCISVISNMSAYVDLAHTGAAYSAIE